MSRARDIADLIGDGVSSSNVKEVLSGVCNGSQHTVSSGTYTFPNVTTSFTTSTSYQDITGSNITYLPPSGTKRVIYEFQYKTGAVDASQLSHLNLYLDGNEVTNARCSETGGGHYGGVTHFMWTFICDGSSDDNANGVVTSWTSGKEIKMQIRAYNTSFQVAVHKNVFFNGSTSQNVIMPPTLKITSTG